MSVQGQLLDVTVIGCSKLKDTEWLSKQDPYVVLEYAGSRYRTKTDTDGGKNPTFNEKYMLPLIEGLREINLSVWNSNTVSTDDFIGSGKILLQKVLSDGYDDGTWPLTSRSGKRSGEVRIIMHYTGSKGKQNSAAPSAPPAHSHAAYPPAHGAYPPPGSSPYGPYPPAGNPPYGAGAYPPPPAYGAQPQYGAYPQQPCPPQAYPQQSCPPQAYPYPAAGAYPPPAGYPPQAYPYPTQGYPPQHGYGGPPPGSYPPY